MATINTFLNKTSRVLVSVLVAEVLLSPNSKNSSCGARNNGFEENLNFLFFSKFFCFLLID